MFLQIWYNVCLDCSDSICHFRQYCIHAIPLDEAKRPERFLNQRFDVAFAADITFWAILKPEMLQRIKIGSFMALICL